MITMSEHARHHLHRRLEDVLGPVEATTLMEHLPVAAPSDLVTRHDLESFGAQLRAELRAESAQFRGEMDRGFAEFRGEMRREFADFRGEMRAEIRGQVRSLLLSLVALQISAAGLVVAVIHLV
jgi:hypothetical protein